MRDMMTLCEKTICTGCSACAAACPQGCISMARDEEGFLRPQIDRALCIECGMCERSCPVLHVPAVGQESAAFAAKAAQEDILRQSTSGGIFTLLCRWVLERGGAVFGAAYEEDHSVAHRKIDSEEELPRLRFAKYTQSVMGNTFAQVRQELEDGRHVLFSGTPCQAAGLKTYLGRPYEKLVLVDVICHGVPSPEVWAHYMRYRGETDAAGELPAKINMRSKCTGWPSYSVEFSYENGAVYRALNHEDPFMRGFVRDLYLRPSCHDCRFKGASRCSDFTLGDYWGVWSQLPTYDDQRGTSLVLVHSAKGRGIWAEICGDARWQQVVLPDCLAENPAAVRSPEVPENRDAFWARYRSEDFSRLIEELLPPPQKPGKTPLWRRVARKLRHHV